MELRLDAPTPAQLRGRERHIGIAALVVLALGLGARFVVNDGAISEADASRCAEANAAEIGSEGDVIAVNRVDHVEPGGASVKAWEVRLVSQTDLLRIVYRVSDGRVLTADRGDPRSDGLTPEQRSAVFSATC